MINPIHCLEDIGNLFLRYGFTPVRSNDYLEIIYIDGTDCEFYFEEEDKDIFRMSFPHEMHIYFDGMTIVRLPYRAFPFGIQLYRGRKLIASLIV